MSWRADSTVYTADSTLITADGFVPVVPPIPSSESFSGGLGIAFEREFARRDRARRKRKEDEELARSIEDSRDREIAAFLHEQEALDGWRQELERLSSLVQLFADKQAEDAFNERVAKAYARAVAQQSASALLAFERELRRQFEDEEFAVLMALAIDD